MDTHDKLYELLKHNKLNMYEIKAIIAEEKDGEIQKILLTDPCITETVDPFGRPSRYTLE